MRNSNSMRCTLAATLLALLAGCDAAPDPERSGAANPGTSGTQTVTDALSSSDPYTRARQLGSLLPTLGPDALPEIKRALDGARLELGAVEFELLLRFWAEQEPAEATAWTFKHASPLYRQAAARTVIEVWAEADPTAALVAVENALAQSDENVARVVQMALVQGWFQKDRETLQAYIHGLGTGMQRQRSLFAFALAMTAADGAPGTARWAESIPDEDRRFKLDVFRQVLSALAWADVSAAAEFCDKHCDGPHARGLRNILTRTRLRNGEDGGQIVEWVANAPEVSEAQRESREHSLWVAYSTWAYRDRSAAVAWMRDKLETSQEPWLELLFAEYARQLAPDAPEEALRWAARVPDPTEREQTLVRIARAWRLEDEAAAESWLETSDLSEDARASARDATRPHYLPKAP